MASFFHHARRVAYDGHKSDHSSARAVRRLQRSAPLSMFVEALEHDGCVIIKDFTDRATIEEADEEIRPWLEKVEEEVKGGGMKSINRY